MKTKINWVNGFKLEGETESGHTLTMDSAAGGNTPAGPTPKELVLQALGGCTMMDVVLILQKSRKLLEKFWIEIDSEIAESHPRVFTKIHLTYNFIGKALDNNTIERAINLSRDKYCAVFNLIKDKAEISYSYNVYDLEGFINHVIEEKEETKT
jgi:putative redox protein